LVIKKTKGRNKMNEEDIMDEIIEDLNYFVYWDLEQLREYLDKTQEKWMVRKGNLELTDYFD